MTELATYTSVATPAPLVYATDPTGGRLIAWADGLAAADRTFTVTLTYAQIDLIVDLLPQPLERELLEEELSVTDRNEARRELDEIERIIDILLDAREAS